MPVPVRFFLWFGLTVMAWLPCGRSQALVNINWGAGAQTFAGDSDVSTAGTLVQASNLGNFENWEAVLYHTNFSIVVNGVTFAAAHVTADVQSISVGSFTLSAGEGALIKPRGSTTPNDGFSTPTSTLSQAYRNLLVGSATTYVPDIDRETPGVGDRTMTLTMPNLTIGRNYQFQWWTAEPTTAVGYVTEATGGIELSANTHGAIGGLGQFALGTFTATDTTMSIRFLGDGDTLVVNAFQLRDVTAVPEPSTYALIFGLCALAWRCVCKCRRRAGL